MFRTSSTWPRTKALYCHPMPIQEWPDEPEIVERVPLRSCKRRGAAIDLVLDRSRAGWACCARTDEFAFAAFAMATCVNRPG